MPKTEAPRFISALGIDELKEKLGKNLARRDGVDRIFPGARVIEVVYLGLVTNYSLFRTEGTSTIDTVELPGRGVTTPVIMPQKITAIARRRLLELLRRYLAILEENELQDFRDNVLCKALELGYTKVLEQTGVKPEDYPRVDSITVKEDGGNKVFKAVFKKSRGRDTKEVTVECSRLTVSWNCSIQPPLEQGTDLGMDTYCPACVLFGAVVTDADNVNMRAGGGPLNIGIKSRVAADPAFSLYPRYELKTHQKVSEGALSSTGTSLYKEPHLVPASLVVGKIALYDVTEAELVAVLLALVSARRYGGRASRYGGLEIYPVAVSAGAYERVSALELAENLASDTKKSLDGALAEVADIIGGDNGFVLAVSRENGARYRHVIRNSLLGYLDDDGKFKNLFRELWRDAIAFDEALVRRVNQLKSG